MLKKVFKFYEDPGHGWLAVKVKDLEAVGSGLHLISHYSYLKGKTVYLEEDCDADKFVKAFEAKFGASPTIKTTFTDGSSPIRSYPRLAESE